MIPLTRTIALCAATALFAVAALSFLAWQGLKPVPTDLDWQEPMRGLSTATLSGDTVTVHGVRNFRYDDKENVVSGAYEDRTYDLSTLTRVWFVSVPFNSNKYAAHTFLSFQFADNRFLAISIEARRTKGQGYDVWKGMLRTYPLMYIAADERDVIPLRTDVRKDRVYAYPVRLSKPENGRLILEDMLRRMNGLAVEPDWYNTITANCTSLIARHVNAVSPGRVSMLSWQLWLTAAADELALKHGLLDTDLPIAEARERYEVTEASKTAAGAGDYSVRIRAPGRTGTAH